MSDGYIGEIRMFAGNYAPKNWQLCNGQLLPIANNEALFSLLSTTYGGDGVNTFALPDLRGRVPLHNSGSYKLGSKIGTETVALSTAQMPAHTHTAQAQSQPGNAASPVNNYWASAPEAIFTSDTSNLQAMATSNVQNSGASQAHNNMMPYLCISYIISTAGMYPSTD